MYRTHNCGALRLADAGKEVTLSGWVNTTRPYGQMTFVDLRDRYGVTQAVFENNEALNKEAMALGREYVIRVVGTVRERAILNWR
jgi:aspartyl-tRNA synthetase